MFKFDFGDTDEGDDASKKVAKESTTNHDAPRAHFVEDIVSTLNPAPGHVDIVELCGGDLLLRKSCSTVPKDLSANGADVVPGVYEGGFKLWECAEDLVVHVHQELGARLKGKSVLEIGAGHALPAVLAAMNGAVVTLHDFNEEVLRAASAPNVVMNMARSDNASAAAPRYIAGDWGTIPALVGSAQFDVVLSSETVYAEGQLRPLARCVLSVLKDGGFALVAGKTYYFGVGGGMQAFRGTMEEVAKEMQVQLVVEVVKELRDGMSNVREITKFWKNRSGSQ